MYDVREPRPYEVIYWEWVEVVETSTHTAVKYIHDLDSNDLSVLEEVLKSQKDDVYLPIVSHMAEQWARWNS